MLVGKLAQAEGIQRFTHSLDDLITRQAQIFQPEGDGWAHATHGVAASPVPMPSATANAPIRPICVAYPVAVYFALLIVVPHVYRRAERWLPAVRSSSAGGIVARVRCLPIA